MTHSCGGYVSGDFAINNIKTFYVYIGGVGDEKVGGYNGGGISQMGGGGATDVRLSDGENWDDLESLKSRIIIAGGGGGSDGESIELPDRGGCGGGLIGGNSNNNKGKGGTQINGGDGIDIGTFGKGGSNNRLDGGESVNDGNGAGGGGYYGGGSSSELKKDGGGGGSSFISGYPGCNAIDKYYTLENPIHTNKSIHFSGFYFNNYKIKDGCSDDIPLPNGNGVGQYCDYGAFRLTIFPSYITCKINTLNHIFFAICSILISIS